MTRDRLQRRIETAIGRAADRYCRRFLLRSGDGGRTLFEFGAVVQTIPTEDVGRAPSEFLAGALGAGVTATRRQLVVARSTWLELERLAGSVDAFKSLLIDEIDLVGNVLSRWRPDASVPIDANSPEGASVRIFLYLVKGQNV